MDDVWIFANDPGDLRKVQVRLHRAMRDAGLEMNFAKTELFEGESLKKQVNDYERASVDAALESSCRDTEPLEKLIEETLAAPSAADRTTLRYLTHRIRKHQLFDLGELILEKFHLMPQAADHLAHLYRESNRWSDFQDSYIKFTSSSWAAIDWSVASLGRMFPSEALVSRNLSDHFLELVSSGASSPCLFPLAAERASRWAPADARAALRNGVDKATTPHRRRALALSALALKEEPTFIRKVLGEFEENQVLLAMIEERRFKPLPVPAEFAGF